MSAYISGRVAAVLSKHGETMTLQRSGQSDLTVVGKRLRPSGAGSDELAPGLAQNDLIVKIGHAEIAASALTTPPKRLDKLVIAGKTYTLQADADTRTNGGVTLAHFLTVKG